MNLSFGDKLITIFAHDCFCFMQHPTCWSNVIIFDVYVFQLFEVQLDNSEDLIRYSSGLVQGATNVFWYGLLVQLHVLNTSLPSSHLRFCEQIYSFTCSDFLQVVYKRESVYTYTQRERERIKSFQPIQVAMQKLLVEIYSFNLFYIRMSIFSFLSCFFC